MMTDLKYALRMLIKAPVFAVISILTLALGIGANTAIFSVVNAVLLRPLPVPAPEQLVQVWESKEFPAGFQGSVSAANLRDWIENNTVFTGLTAYSYANFALQGKESPERLVGSRVTANYFNVIGLPPRLGRTFAPGEDQAGGAAVAVISENLWRAQFASDPAVIGRVVVLDGRPFTIIGVMPASFALPSPRNQVWVPLFFSSAELAQRGEHSYLVTGRLREGVSLAQAHAQMNSIAQEIARKFPDEQLGRGVKLVPLREQLTGANRASLLVLLGSVACVLLIGSANIANLLLARTAGRRREIALRLALGASRARLLRQFLTESLLLALLGGAAGFLTAGWGRDLLVALIGNRLNVPVGVHLDPAVLGFTSVVTLLVGVSCGLAPARQALGRPALDMQTALHGHAAVAGAKRMRSALVIAEMALAVVLLSGAGLLLRSFARLQQTDSGLVRPEQVLTARVSLPGQSYPTTTAVSDFYDRLLGRIIALPGVDSAGVINFLPLAQWGWNGNVEIEGRSPFPPGKSPQVEFRTVAGDYFSTMGVALVAGRFLDAHDGPTHAGSVLVNRAMARQLWENENQALGAKIKVGADHAFTVVGIVGDVRQAGLDRPPQPEMYFPVSQALDSPGPGGSMAQTATICIRAHTPEPTGLVDSVRRSLREIDPGLPLFRVETLRSVMNESVADQRLNGVLLGTFAAIALGLAALGLYGVVSYAVAQRTRELGIRMALGAQRNHLFRLVVGGGMRLALAGSILGLLAAIGLARFLKSLLYSVAPSDPSTFGVVILLLGLVAFFANYFPARRAMKVDPMVALRYE